jgi:hypothetical protein
VESDFIVKYLNYIIQAYCSCIFSMEARWNVWSPWYLMPKDKSKKVECKFWNNDVISYCNNRMLFHFSYRYDGNGWVGVVMYSRAQPWAKALFAQCGKLVLPPLNGMEILAHFLDGRTKDMAIEMSNPSMER